MSENQLLLGQLLAAFERLAQVESWDQELEDVLSVLGRALEPDFAAIYRAQPGGAPPSRAAWVAPRTPRTGAESAEPPPEIPEQLDDGSDDPAGTRRFPIAFSNDRWGVLLVRPRHGLGFGSERALAWSLAARLLGAGLERHEIASDLRHSEDLYRGLFENANDFVYTHDLEGTYTSMNEGGARLTGYSKEELMAMSGKDLIAPEYLELAQDMTRRKLAGEEDVTAYELEVVTKSGEKLAVEVSSRVVFNEGEPVAIQGIARDITERRHMEANLRRALKMEAIGRLAGGVAHDFNNLLTVINGNCRQLISKLGTEHRELQDIREAGEQATNLTRQLLAFSAQQVMQPKTLDLNQVVSRMENMLRRVIGEHIELTTDVEDGLAPIRADEGQIEQVVMNLVINARDVMPQGGKLHISTSTRTLEPGSITVDQEVLPGEYCLLAVSDTGEGMDQQTLARLFEPFFTTKEKGKGTGLGLSTVYGIVSQCGGYVTASSRPGHGARFEVYLPRTEGEMPSRTPEPEQTTQDGGGETILLVEDEGMVRTFVQTVLEQHGYRVIATRDAAEAIEQFEAERRKPVDLLLSDVVMPGMGGPELAERLLRDRADLAIVFMSGYTDSFILKHGLWSKDSCFLQKPFSPESLLEEIRRALDRATVNQRRL